MKVTLTEPGIAGSYAVAENRPDGVLVLEPEREKLSAVIAEAGVKVFRDEEFIEHLERVSQTDDDLGDYEPEQPRADIRARTAVPRSGVDQGCRSRIVFLGGLRSGLREGSSAGRRWRDGSRSARREWSRSLTRAGSATSSGRPPGGGSGRFEGARGPRPPSSPSSDCEGPGEEKKRSRTAGTNSTSANTSKVKSSGSGSKPTT